MSDIQNQTPVADEAPSLGIQDIKNALMIIDFAFDQGSFKTMSTVRQVLTARDKLAAFVAYAEANADQPAAAEAAQA